MRPIAIAAATVFISQAIAGAHAAEDRYRLEKTDNGYVRMDTQTGAMSICEERSGQLVCKLAADEREAYQTQIDQLQSALKAIESRVTALEKNRPALQAPLPTEEEFEKGMSYMERFFRRFMDIVKDFDKEEKQPNQQPQGQLEPNKT
ncbi:hypothetical protein [Pseudaminobacter soli (ex Li et al. 2025)]|uniref:Uncharacterized protein n=1 Tax=Pseudaminobacter soli (ex Li et al. 2025) TaxID=1295366 RepID=A0A2P7SDB3_9HYPH|nr:hypothetical protein [Mesorhizobium soli]PSJ60457.1 hypothetical protein C7I85_14430 [Mesorhizobium soli]